MPSSTDDPVRLLLGAAREGLFEYAGHTVGDKYEVRFADDSWQVPGGAVASLITQLRAIRRLDAEHLPSRLVEVYPDTGSFRIEVGAVAHIVPGWMVADWVDGYLAGFHRGDQPHAGEESFGEIWKVLENPGIADRARMVILGLMHGDPAHPMSMEQLARKVGVTKKTIIAALAFGEPLRLDLADRMIAAFDRRWSVTSEGVKDPTGRVVSEVVEMPGIERLRRIGEAVAARWVKYVGKPSPNRMRWDDETYELAVGQTTYRVEPESLEGWLAGLEAWYSQQETTPAIRRHVETLA